MKMLVGLTLLTGLVLAPQGAASEESDKDRDALHEELAQARRELADAARRVGELGRQLGADGGENYRFHAFAPDAPRRAMLGISIGEHDEESHGVEILSVTPGGPADQAGLRAGDVIAKIGKTDLAQSDDAPGALLKVLGELEPGEAVEVDYRRGNDERSATIETEAFDAPFRLFARKLRDGMPELPHIPRAPMFLELMHGWGDIELAPVSKGLGEYFGTDRGLLVVSAPEEEGFKLQDGDVILSIAGREPEDPAHAMRILRSYRGGEKLTLDVMRKHEKVTLEVEVPERRTGATPLRRKITVGAPAPG